MTSPASYRGGSEPRIPFLRCAQFYNFKKDQKLVEAGQQWPYVMFVLSGVVAISGWNLEVPAGGQLGGCAFFGQSLFGDTSAVKGVEEGVVAGLTLQSMNSLTSGNGAGSLAHKVLLLVGEYAMQLVEASVGSQSGSQRVSAKASMPAESKGV